ncbi:MAG: SBBP repeat-containing protein, partial [Bacteroidales bacterium]|nr:SBBP repeat-containing protein [Bacteroidales bacterium]
MKFRSFGVLLLFISLLFVFPVTYAQNWEWSSHLTSSNKVRVNAVAYDKTNDALLTISVFKDVTNIGTKVFTPIGGINKDILIVKYNNIGDTLWTRQIGSNNNDVPENIIVDESGNIYITGSFSDGADFGGTVLNAYNQEDAFLAKYNPDGTLAWAKNIGQGQNRQKGNGLAIDNSGNIYMVGFFQDSIDFGNNWVLYDTAAAGLTDNFIAKFNDSGVLLDTIQIFGTDDGTRLNAISIANDGEILISGFFLGQLTIKTQTLTAQGAGEDIVFIKMDATNNLDWIRQAGSTGNDRGYHAQSDIAGNIYLIGYITGTANVDSTGTGIFDAQSITSNGGSDIFLAKYNTAGTLQWKTNLGSTGEDIGYGLNIFENLLHFTGYFSDTVIFKVDTIISADSTDVFFGVVDMDGNPIAAKSIQGSGGTGCDRGQGIAYDGQGNEYVVGYFESTNLTIGLDIWPNGGQTDGFVAKYNLPFSVTYTKQKDVTCNGGDDGELIVTPFFGAPPYNYVWTPSVSTDSTASSLSGGTYRVDVTDNNSDVDFVTTDITEPTEISISEVVTNVFCHPDNGSGNDGAIDITVSGGTPAYTYNWTTSGGSGVSATAEDQTGLTAGTYYVTVTDDNSCEAKDTFIVAQPDSISFSGTIVTDIINPPGGNGAVDLSVNGGTIPYQSYSWTGPNLFTSSTEDISNLADGGTYSVVVTDANGCTGDTAIFVNDVSSLSGSYSISLSSPDFLNFTEAVDSLISVGISGPVIFNVESGTYTEQISIPEINGASETNTITFQSESGDSTDVILTWASTLADANYTLRLDGADYITFRNMTLRATGANYARLVEITNGAQNNEFSYNRIIGVTTTSTDLGALIYSAGSNDDNNLIEENRFEDGTEGLHLSGVGSSDLEKGTYILNNHFVNQTIKAIILADQDAPVIQSNIIQYDLTDYGFKGIHCGACDNNLIIEKNKILLPNANGGCGIEIGGSDGTPGDEGIIANNFIQINTSGGSAEGIWNTGSTYQRYLFNSVNITGYDGFGSRAIKIDASSSDIELKNNTFANNVGGGTIASENTTNISSNYNNLYSTGTNLAYWNSTGVTSLSAWQSASGQDANSISIDPEYLSDSDLHIENFSLKAGTPLAEVTDDIDGDTRDATTPFIGADELTGLQIDSLALVALYDSTNGAGWINSSNWLLGNVSTWYGINFSGNRVTEISLSNNNLTGTIPTEIGNLINLTSLILNVNELSGSIPSEIGNLINLSQLVLSSNQLSCSIPSEIGNLTNLAYLGLNYNQLSGSIPTEIGSLTNLTSLGLSNNQFKDLSDLSLLTSLEYLYIQNNQFTFKDIEPNIGVASTTFAYAPQDSVGEIIDTTVYIGTSFTMSVSTGGTSSQYQWKKDGTNFGTISGDSTYTFSPVVTSDSGTYTCEITNTVATELTLYSRPINVTFTDKLCEMISNWEDVTPPWQSYDPGTFIVDTIENPDKTGINPSDSCVKLTTTTDRYEYMWYDLPGTETWSFDTYPVFKLMVNAPTAGDIVLRFENSNNTVSVGRQAHYSNPGLWEELIFDFTGVALDGLIKMVIYPDYNNTIEGNVWYIDEIIHCDLQLNAGIIDLLIPDPGCGLTNNEPITVQITNFGIDTISNFDVSYQIDDGTVITETVTSIIFPGDTLTYTFSTNADLYTTEFYRIYYFSANTMLTGDEGPDNDNYNKTIRVYGDHIDREGWTTYSICDGMAGNGGTTGVVEDGSGNIWVGTDEGVSVYNGVSWITYDTVNSPLTSNWVEKLYADDLGNVWIGTWVDEGGVCKYDGSTWTIYTTENSGIAGNVVEEIIKDSNGNYWFATYSGISKFNGISTWTTYNTGNSGLVNDFANAITEDSNGNIWIGTGSGVSKFDVAGDTWTTYNTGNSGLGSNYIYAVREDNQGNIWFGTYGGGITKLNGTTWTTYTTSNSDFPINRVLSIMVDSNGNVWFGTFGKGAVKYDGTTWIIYNEKNGLVTRNNNDGWIYFWGDIFEDSNGNLWFPSYNGVAKKEPVSIEIYNIEFSNSTCNGTNDGTITIYALAENPPLQYSIDGGTTFQSDNVFTGLAPGTYPIVVTDGINTVSTDTVVLMDFDDISTYPYTENFDSYAVNSTSFDYGWHNETSNKLDWMVYSGSTPSPETGPETDQSGSGNYLYLEASNNYFDQASLISPCFDISGLSNSTLKFYYHMYGTNMGELSLDIYSGGTWINNVVYISGDQGIDWLQNTVDLSPYSSIIKLRFRGIIGDSFRSDIAIDNIEVTGISNENDILTYSFAEQTGAATIDDINHTVNIEVAYGTDVTTLTATFTISALANITVNTTSQISGVTSNDFSSPVTYTVTAEDGTTQDWVVTVTVASAPS